MKRIKEIGILIFIVFFASCASGGIYARGKATLRVTDEKGEPVRGAKAGIIFKVFDKFPGHADGDSGLTGSDGLFSYSARTDGDLRYYVRKEGYYNTGGFYGWPQNRREDGRWIPWNPVIDVTLKSIENPVPMYAKRVRTSIPLGKFVGYDLEKGDWVTPYGKGMISDFLFKADRQGNTFENFKIRLELTFSNKGDGIQSIITPPYDTAVLNVLKLPKFAPEEGYQEKWVKEIGNTPETGEYNLDENKNQNFIFRIRTILDENGNIKFANYGKIHGDVDISGYSGEKIGLKFTYYFNPDGTRNLECDPKKNLLKGHGLQSSDAPTEP